MYISPVQVRVPGVPARMLCQDTNDRKNVDCTRAFSYPLSYQKGAAKRFRLAMTRAVCVPVQIVHGPTGLMDMESRGFLAGGFPAFPSVVVESPAIIITGNCGIARGL